MVKKSSWNKGIPMSNESKIKLSNSLKGRVSWNKGKKIGCLSKEHKKKLSENLKGKTWEEIYGVDEAKKRHMSFFRNDEQKIVNMFVIDKMTRGEISSKLKTCYNTINKIFKKYNITGINKKPLTVEHKKNIGIGCKGKNTGSFEDRYGKQKADRIKDKIRANTVKQHIKGFPQTNTKIEIKMKDILDKFKIKYVHPYNFNNKFACDFAIPSKKIIIECDGDYWHRRKDIIGKDKSKNSYIKKCGWKMLRYWETDINNNINTVINDICHNISNRQYYK